MLACHTRPLWPALIRGDRAWGSERTWRAPEQEGVPFLFKLRLTKGVKQSIEGLMREAHWCDAGWGWEGGETPLR